VEIQAKEYCVNLNVFICVDLLTWHGHSGQLHVTIEPGGAAVNCMQRRISVTQYGVCGRAVFKAWLGRI